MRPVTLLAIAALALVALAPSASAATAKERAQARQIKKLTSRVTTLESELAAIRRDVKALTTKVSTTKASADEAVLGVGKVRSCLTYVPVTQFGDAGGTNTEGYAYHGASADFFTSSLDLAAKGSEQFRMLILSTSCWASGLDPHRAMVAPVTVPQSR